MVHLSDLSHVLLAGAESLDRANPCVLHGADSGEPCADDDGRALHCRTRVSGDPILARTLRAMAKECTVRSRGPHD